MSYQVLMTFTIFSRSRVAITHFPCLQNSQHYVVKYYHLWGYAYKGHFLVHFKLFSMLLCNFLVCQLESKHYTIFRVPTHPGILEKSLNFIFLVLGPGKVLEFWKKSEKSLNFRLSPWILKSYCNCAFILLSYCEFFQNFQIQWQ